MHGLDRIAQALGQLGNLETSIRGVTAPVIKEVADIVGLEDLDEPFVLRAILLETLQLVPAGSERARGRVPKSRNGRWLFTTGVDQVLGQRSNNPVAPGQDFANPAPVFLCGFDHPTGRGIDHRGHPAGLRVEDIFCFSHCGAILISDPRDSQREPKPAAKILPRPPAPSPASGGRSGSKGLAIPGARQAPPLKYIEN